MTFLDSLKAAQAAATPGPWPTRTTYMDGTLISDADRDLIVLLRNAAPELLALLKAVKLRRTGRILRDKGMEDAASRDIDSAFDALNARVTE